MIKETNDSYGILDETLGTSSSSNSLNSEPSVDARYEAARDGLIVSKDPSLPPRSLENRVQARLPETLALAADASGFLRNGLSAFEPTSAAIAPLGVAGGAISIAAGSLVTAHGINQMSQGKKVGDREAVRLGALKTGSGISYIGAGVSLGIAKAAPHSSVISSVAVHGFLYPLFTIMNAGLIAYGIYKHSLIHSFRNDLHRAVREGGLEKGIGFIADQLKLTKEEKIKIEQLEEGLQEQQMDMLLQKKWMQLARRVDEKTLVGLMPKIIRVADAIQENRMHEIDHGNVKSLIEQVLQANHLEEVKAKALIAVCAAGLIATVLSLATGGAPAADLAFAMVSVLWILVDKAGCVELLANRFWFKQIESERSILKQNDHGVIKASKDLIDSWKNRNILAYNIFTKSQDADSVKEFSEEKTRSLQIRLRFFQMAEEVLLANSMDDMSEFQKFLDRKSEGRAVFNRIKEEYLIKQPELKNFTELDQNKRVAFSLLNNVYNDAILMELIFGSFSESEIHQLSKNPIAEDIKTVKMGLALREHLYSYGRAKNLQSIVHADLLLSADEQAVLARQEEITKLAAQAYPAFYKQEFIKNVERAKESIQENIEEDLKKRRNILIDQKNIVVSEQTALDLDRSPKTFVDQSLYEEGREALSALADLAEGDEELLAYLGVMMSQTPKNQSLHFSSALIEKGLPPMFHIPQTKVLEQRFTSLQDGSFLVSYSFDVQLIQTDERAKQASLAFDISYSLRKEQGKWIVDLYKTTMLK